MSEPVEVATLAIQVTLTLPYREAVAALNRHHRWSGALSEEPPPALVEATHRALRSQSVTLLATLKSDGSWTVETKAGV